VFLPLLSGSAGQNLNAEKRYLRWLGNATVGLALPIAVGGFILAVPLTQFVFGSQYSGSGILFRWLMLTIVTGPVASYFGAQLIPNGRERKYLAAVLAGAAANVVLNLFLLPRYGAVAATFTTAFSQGVVALMNYHFVKDLTRPSLLAAMAMSLPATCLMAVSLVIVRTAYPVHVLALIAFGALLYLGVYGLSLGLWNRIAEPRP
jgi:O-antigen/teichoic acid export membrane protein